MESTTVALTRFTLMAVILLMIGGLSTGCSFVKEYSKSLVQGYGKSDEQPMEFAVKALNRSVLQCPERIWPEANWKDVQTLLVNNDRKTACLWNGSGTGDIAQIGYTSLPEELHKFGWNEAQWKNQKATSIVLDDYSKDPTGVIELFGHESFHLVNQSNWNRNSSMFFRGDLYPEDWKPRYIRRMIMRALFKALVTGDRGALGAAAYWHQKYRSEFPQDFERSKYTDRTEGAAEYVGLLTGALGTLGCNASNEQILGWLRKRVGELWDKKWDNLSYHPSAREMETNAIGLLAGFLLDAEEVPGWKQLVAASAGTPMDILARHIEPVQAPDDPAVTTRVMEYYARQNKAMKAALDEFLDRRQSTDFMFLAVPYDRLIPGTLAREAFLGNMDGNRFRKFILSMEARFSTPSPTSQIEVKGVTAEMVDSKHALGGFGYYVIPIPASALKVTSGGIYSIVSDKVKAPSLIFELHEDPMTGKWLWVQ